MTQQWAHQSKRARPLPTRRQRQRPSCHAGGMGLSRSAIERAMAQAIRECHYERPVIAGAVWLWDLIILDEELTATRSSWPASASCASSAASLVAEPVLVKPRRRLRPRDGSTWRNSRRRGCRTCPRAKRSSSRSPVHGDLFPANSGRSPVRRSRLLTEAVTKTDRADDGLHRVMKILST